MCGIATYVGRQSSIVTDMIDGVAGRLHHRGPDDSGVFHIGSTVLAHRRLSIIDVAGGKQPLYNEIGDLALVCNGEIYNHERLRRELQDRHYFRTHSDSEVILHLYEDFGPACVTKLDGMFAFVLSDGKQVFAARDPLGIKLLYMGRDADGGLWFASELKALIDVCASIEEIPPGTAYAVGTVWSSCCKWDRFREAYLLKREAYKRGTQVAESNTVRTQPPRGPRPSAPARIWS